MSDKHRGSRRAPNQRQRVRKVARFETLEPRLVLNGDFPVVELPGVGPEWTVFLDQREYLPIDAAPAERLEDARVLGEWNTPGALEGWQVSNAAGATVADGALSAEFNASGVTQIALFDIAGGVYLDFGAFDYVQLRMRLPEDYSQDVTLRYETDAGRAAGGDFVLPASLVDQDGEWRTYRFDVGLEVFWRDTLTSLRVQAPTTGVAGDSVSLDYVEVGDLPGDNLLINDNLNLSPEVSAAGDLTRIESKHFATWWSPTVSPQFDPAFNGRNALRMLEESFQVYQKVLGYIEPFYGPNLPPPVQMDKVNLDFFGDMPEFVELPEHQVTVPFVSDGAELEFVATLDAVKDGADASLYRNGAGVFPVTAGSGGGGGDGNTWLDNEELVLSYQILEDGVDVTSDYEVAVTGATAEWRNSQAARFGLQFGSDQPTAFGRIVFSGAPGWETSLVSPATPIDITGAGAGFEIDLSPTYDDHFRLRDLRLDVHAEGGGGGSSPDSAPSPLPRLDVPRYKTNHITWYDGFWMSAWDGFTYFNVGEPGLRDEGWGNPVPHEFGHAVDGAQPAFLAGGHWESHANYYRENWINYFAPLFPTGQQSQLSQRVLTNSGFRQDHPRFIYQDYRIHLALQDYAAQLGLAPNVAAQLWQVGEAEESVYAKLESLLPEGLTVADVMGETMRYWPVLDFAYGDLMRDNLWTTATEKAMYDYQVGSLLVPSADEPGWSRVPFERAPEKYAYMFHELTPTDSAVTVELRGVDVLGDQEDWRWSLVAIDEEGNPRYSDSWAPGTHSFELMPDENRVLLVVVATPDDVGLDLESYYNTKPSDKHIDRLRYPYEVRIEGATQASKQLDWNATSGDYHTNPDGGQGGWVASSAYVSPTAYVGPNAKVLGSARVENTARVEDYAVVAGNARVRGDGVVSGYAAVIDNAIVEENARVRDRALIKNSARVRGDAMAEDYAILIDGTTLTGSAVARGSVEAFTNATVSGTAILDYDYSMGWAVDDGVHQNHIAFGGWFGDFYAQTETKPRGLVASYRTEAPEGEVLWDEFGAQHALLRGGADRVWDGQMGSEVIRLNGQDQHLLIDRSVVDLRDGAFGVWAKPASSTAGQTLLYAGDGQGDYLQLLARNGQGVPEVTLSIGGQEWSVTGDAPLALHAWSHVAFTFGDGQMILYVDGENVGQTSVPHTPADVLGPNDYLSAQPLYVGRGAEGGHFDGNIEDVRFYNVTRTPLEVQQEMNRKGAALGVFYAETPMDFNGASATDESGVRNGLERTLTAMVRPESSSNVSFYEPVFDSNDERSGRAGSGFGLDNGQWVVRLDGVGFWNTGVAAELGEWQEVTVAFDGSEAFLYVNGERMASRTYSANPDALAGKNYRIGFGQSSEDTGSRTYFDGQIHSAQIFDRMILPDARLAGDYNQDGLVDGGDFTVWRDTLGQAVTPGEGADGDQSGVVDAADYGVWQGNYGAVFATAPPAEAWTGPEPTLAYEPADSSAEPWFAHRHEGNDGHSNHSGAAAPQSSVAWGVLDEALASLASASPTAGASETAPYTSGGSKSGLVRDDALLLLAAAEGDRLPARDAAFGEPREDLRSAEGDQAEEPAHEDALGPTIGPQL